MRRTTPVLALLAALLLISSSAWAQPSVPYKDRVVGTIVDAEQQNDGRIRLTFETVGQATQLGRFVSNGELLVSPADLTFTGSNILTAANGDQIFLILEGELTPTDEPGIFVIALSTTFTGGNGRFKIVQGGFDGVGIFTLADDGSFVGGQFIGDGVGTMTTTGAGKK